MELQKTLSWLKRIIVILLSGIFALVILGASFQMVATAVDQQKLSPPGKLFEVEGHKLHLYCIGENLNHSPTVILESGGGGISLSWFLLQPKLAQKTRVCSYDRAGLGFSEAGGGIRSGNVIAEDLHGLLQKAEIKGPYVLVGHSYGGLYIRSFAEKFPEQVAGLVFLDAAHPKQWLTPQGQTVYSNDSRIYSVARLLVRLGILRLMQDPLSLPPEDLPMEQRATWAALTDTTLYWDTVAEESEAIGNTMASLSNTLGNFPLLVISAGEHINNDPKWKDFQEDLLQLSPKNSYVVIDGATHTSLWSEPKEVLRVAQVIADFLGSMKSF